MAGQCITPMEGITDYKAWEQEQQVWIKFVKEGGLLSEVPELHRRDKVCLYASLNAKLGDNKIASEHWRKEILPHIPIDVLFMGFMNGNIGHKIAADADEREKQNERPIVVAHMRPRMR